MEYILGIIIGYLLGCSNMAFYVSKFKKIDLRKEGSGNLGTSNTVTEIGLKAGLLVFFHDAFKAVIAILLMKLLYPNAQLAHYVTGVAVIIGHIFPFYTKFKGGKGFASYIGMIYTLHPIFALCATPIVIGLILFTDYMVVGTFSVAIGFMAFLFIIGKWEAGLLSLVVFALMFIKHIENFKRIIAGTEKGVMEGLTKKKSKQNLDPTPTENPNQEN
jgi:glycerol-3-phosphate acyltransferase PlsY